METGTLLMYGTLLRLARLVSANPLRYTAQNDDRYRANRDLPTAQKTYCIFFTPRSGSSNLTDLLSSTRRLGRPKEFFNPRFAAGQAKDLGARSVSEYLDVLPRARQIGGLFGFEITYRQLVGMFPNERVFFDWYGGADYFWLIREDIVAQAVSASRKRQTRVSSTVLSPRAAVEEADEHFVYRPREIKDMINRLRWMERQTERYFRRFGIAPLRLSYERLIELGPLGTATVFADELGVEMVGGRAPVSRYKKLLTRKGPEFAARFRARHAGWLDRIDAQRAEMLAGLKPLDRIRGPI